MVASLLSLSAGCDSNFLERLPLTEFDDAATWSDPALVRGFVSTMYEAMDHAFKPTMFSAFTDESYFTHDWETYRIVKGELTEATTTSFTDGRDRIMLIWRDNFAQIRNANVFFEKVGQVPFTNASEKNQITGEVHFLRAWNYFQLLRMYGGVPIIDRVYGLNEADALRQVERASFAETVNFILDDIEKAILLLQEATDVDRGIIHKSAAKALKSRVTLHAASDLYNKPNTINDNNTNPLVGYTITDSGDQESRWKAARDAANAIISEGKYALHAPSGGSDPTADYIAVFLDKGNSESIFSKLFHRELYGTEVDNRHGPNGYHSGGGDTPTQNLVDVYQNRDGTPFSWGNPTSSGQFEDSDGNIVTFPIYEGIDPYKDRDPRFYGTILYNGAKWKDRYEDGKSRDPDGVIQTALTFEHWNADNSSKEVRIGLDIQNGGIESWNGTYTGYYLRKFMDITLDAWRFKGDQDYIFFRYAEILLNHAEACIELGEEAAAKASLKQVRKRAGMPETDVDAASGDALRNLCRYERRVELAFEEHRFHDARRWKTAEVDFNEDARNIEITGKLASDNVTQEWTYAVKRLQVRAFPEKMYFMPIPASERRANPKLKQNPGY